MCLSCGCGQPNDDHGDARNITMNDLNQAAEAAGTTRDKVLQNIMNGTQSSPSTNGQSQQPAYNQAQAQQNNAGVQNQQGPVGQQTQHGFNDQTTNEENNYGQLYSQPGTPGTTQGQESGTAWRQDTEDVNYVPPGEPKQEPKRS